MGWGQTQVGRAGKEQRLRTGSRRRQGDGGRAGTLVALTASSALPALRALLATALRRSHSLLPVTAAAFQLPYLTHQLFIVGLQLPGRGQSQAEALLMGPPLLPRRQPASHAYGQSYICWGRGWGGGARGAGTHGAHQGNFLEPATRKALQQPASLTTHLSCACLGLRAPGAVFLFPCVRC